MLKPIWKTDQKARHVFGSKPEDLVLMQVAKLFTPLCHVLSLYYPSEGNNLSTLSNAADLPMRVSSLGSTNLEGKKTESINSAVSRGQRKKWKAKLRH